ncbi:transcription factor GTE7-like [Pyrus communis]|uniref:transcription factor GTE7-like n=1 Tax=Pyrus communis TaxID=23211 RepID=UPI0035C07D1D
MASAVLANRNEPNWPQQPRGGGAGARGGFMGKVPFSSSNTHRNPNPKKRQFQAHHSDFNDESPAVTQTASDDASSINHHRRSNTNDVNPVQSQYVSFNIASYSRKELVELKNRLLYELDQIRVLKNQIEAGDFNPKSAHKKPIGNKKMAGSKRSLPIAHGKESSSNSKRSHLENGDSMKNCGQVLSKLMKQKYAWIFNRPVDVVTLGLHDYYDIIKKPMDLGTVKTNLAKGLYSSPSDFAAEVRLTFENAMRYNPQGHEVYNYANQLRSRFEELFQPLIDKHGDEFRSEKGSDEELQASSWNHVEPERVSRRETPVRIDKKPEPVRPPPVRSSPVPAPVSSSNPLSNPALAQSSPVRTNSQLKGSGVKPLKQPKPKAKDPNKRDMSMEEKQKLGIGLQSLPQEKMEQVVQIIRKRNGHLKQDGDEIELDIEAVDTETLWELDRLVTNWKKMVSKIKRQALMGNTNSNSNSNIASNRGHLDQAASEKVEVAATAEPKRSKKGEAGDEDVDIGDDMPMSSFPPVEIEKDVGGHASSDSSSSSGSSSSGSSSSSDSDSGSSSGSDSDDDNVQS